MPSAKYNFPLTLPYALLFPARRWARAQTGGSLNAFIVDAVARRVAELERAAQFYGLEAPLDALSQKAEAAISAALKKASPQNQSALVNICQGIGLGRNRALSELQRMMRKRIIVAQRGTANTVLYALTRPREKKT